MATYFSCSRDSGAAGSKGPRRHASAAASALPQSEQWLARVTLYPPVPMSIQRVADVERAQMLVESPSRATLQSFLALWHTALHATRGQEAGRGLIRWAVDVDPLSI